MILEPAAFFVVLVSVLRDRDDVRRFVAALVAGAALAALVALALIPFGAVVTEVFPPRVRGTFGSPNNLALVLEAGGAGGAGPGRGCTDLVQRAEALELAAGGRIHALSGCWHWACCWRCWILTWSRGAWLGALVGMAVAGRPLWAHVGTGRPAGGRGVRGGGAGVDRAADRR